uniref:Uncharacterized protein n=1 Tax=Sphaerodactylus townsendi TaxID=933632 RepID=A0ACB8E6K8_9SAUR
MDKRYHSCENVLFGGGQAQELEEPSAVKTDLTFPKKTAPASAESCTQQNNCNKPSHFHRSLPRFPSDEDNANRVGNEIIKLTEEQTAAELEETRAQFRTKSQMAGQPELNSFSEGESPSLSPQPSDSTESGNADGNQSLEEENNESSDSDAENTSVKKDENGGSLCIFGTVPARTYLKDPKGREEEGEY